jgi:hypothetical protein
MAIESAVLLAALLAPMAATRIDDWRAKPHRNDSVAPASATIDDWSNPDFAAATDSLLTPITSYAYVDRLELLQAEIASYGLLDDDWDGAGAKAPERAVLEHAEHMIAILPSGIPAPRPMIGADGRVGLYWDRDTSFADIEIEPNGSFSLFTRWKVGTREETYDEATVHGTNVSSLLKARLGDLFASNEWESMR